MDSFMDPFMDSFMDPFMDPSMDPLMDPFTIGTPSKQRPERSCEKPSGIKSWRGTAVFLTSLLMRLMPVPAFSMKLILHGNKSKTRQMGRQLIVNQKSHATRTTM
jgi:hypothetical protein